MAFQAVVHDDFFDKLSFINKILTEIRPQLGEERRTHGDQNAVVEIHDGEKGDSHPCTCGYAFEKLCKYSKSNLRS
jgi:hypothetical protein